MSVVRARLCFVRRFFLFQSCASIHTPRCCEDSFARGGVARGVWACVSRDRDAHLFSVASGTALPRAHGGIYLALPLSHTRVVPTRIVSLEYFVARHDHASVAPLKA